MGIDIDEKNLKCGVLGLIIALVEIIREAIKLQAVRCMEAGRQWDPDIVRAFLALLGNQGKAASDAVRL